MVNLVDALQMILAAIGLLALLGGAGMLLLIASGRAR